VLIDTGTNVLYQCLDLIFVNFDITEGDIFSGSVDFKQ